VCQDLLRLCWASDPDAGAHLSSGIIIAAVQELIPDVNAVLHLDAQQFLHHFNTNLLVSNVTPYVPATIEAAPRERHFRLSIA